MSDRPLAVQDLLAVIDRLAALLAKEVATLKAMRPMDLKALQGDKANLLSAYEAGLKALREGQARELTPEQRQGLADAGNRLQQVLAENARALNAVKLANERIIGIVVDAVERENRPLDGYAHLGRGGCGPRIPQGRGAPLALDQSL